MEAAMPHMKESLSLTLSQFMTSAQENILVRRHGRQNEEEGGHRDDKNSIYRLFEAQLTHRLVECNVKVETARLDVIFSLKRFYSQSGRLCRIHYLTEDAFEIRTKEPKQYEILLIQIAGWMAAKHFSSPPQGVRLVYHVHNNDPIAPAALHTWVNDMPLAPAHIIESHVARRIEKLADAIILPDESLPFCTLNERHGTDHRPFKKCGDYCRAREHCKQFAGSKTEGDGGTVEGMESMFEFSGLPGAGGDLV